MLGTERTFRLAQGLNQSGDQRVLGTISMDGIAAAIWTRDLGNDLRAWIDELPEDYLPHLNRWSSSIVSRQPCMPHATSPGRRSPRSETL